MKNKKNISVHYIQHYRFLLVLLLFSSAASDMEPGFASETLLEINGMKRLNLSQWRNIDSWFSLYWRAITEAICARVSTGPEAAAGLPINQSPRSKCCKTAVHIAGPHKSRHPSG